METWQKLFDLGIEEIYPGHGKRFKVEKAVKEFERGRRGFFYRKKAGCFCFSLPFMIISNSLYLTVKAGGTAFI